MDLDKAWTILVLLMVIGIPIYIAYDAHIQGLLAGMIVSLDEVAFQSGGIYDKQWVGEIRTNIGSQGLYGETTQPRGSLEGDVTNKQFTIGMAVTDSECRYPIQDVAELPPYRILDEYLKIPGQRGDKETECSQYPGSYFIEGFGTYWYCIGPEMGTGHLQGNLGTVNEYLESEITLNTEDGERDSIRVDNLNNQQGELVDGGVRLAYLTWAGDLGGSENCPSTNTLTVYDGGGWSVPSNTAATTLTERRTLLINRLEDCSGAALNCDIERTKDDFIDKYNSARRTVLNSVDSEFQEPITEDQGVLRMDTTRNIVIPSYQIRINADTVGIQLFPADPQILGVDGVDGGSVSESDDVYVDVKNNGGPGAVYVSIRCEDDIGVVDSSRRLDMQGGGLQTAVLTIRGGSSFGSGTCTAYACPEEPGFSSLECDMEGFSWTNEEGFTCREGVRQCRNIDSVVECRDNEYVVVEQCSETCVEDGDTARCSQDSGPIDPCVDYSWYDLDMVFECQGYTGMAKILGAPAGFLIAFIVSLTRLRGLFSSKDQWLSIPLSLVLGLIAGVAVYIYIWPAILILIGYVLVMAVLNMVIPI